MEIIIEHFSTLSPDNIQKCKALKNGIANMHLYLEKTARYITFQDAQLQLLTLFLEYSFKRPLNLNMCVRMSVQLCVRFHISFNCPRHILKRLKLYRTK